MKYKAVMFDMDGTLVDSTEGIFNSLRHTFNNYGVTTPNDLSIFIGKPLQDSFYEYIFHDKDKAWEAVGVFRKYYGDKAMYDCQIYPGILEILQDLQEQNINVFIATSKPTIFAQKIMAQKGKDHLFREIIGCHNDGTRSDKKELIEHALSFVPNVQKEHAIMIGDRNYDAIGAAKNGVTSIGVTYGFGNREELQEANASYIVDTVAELREVLFS